MVKLRKILAVMTVICLCLNLAACGTGAESGETTQKEVSEDKQQLPVYTYNTYLTSTPETWNPHIVQKNEGSYITEYTALGLYSFDFDESMKGYNLYTEMAADFPEDVTKNYAGKYDVPSDEAEGYAFKVKLNEKAKWENGAYITADDWIYSMKMLLDSDLKNKCAKNYFTGDVKISGAYGYFNADKAGRDRYIPVADVDYKYADVDDGNKFFSISAENCMFFGNDHTFQEYYETGYTEYYCDSEGNDLYKKLMAICEDSEYVQLTDEIKEILKVIAGNFGDNNPNVYNEFCYYLDGIYEDTAWEDVGFLKTGEHEITIITEEPVSAFDIEYLFTEPILVNEKLYENCIDGNNCLYGTSGSTYLSYGPYKISKFDENEEIHLVKNEQWYGYDDDNQSEFWQTTDISIKIISSQEAAMELFIAGKLDYAALSKADMDSYGNSEYIKSYPQPYTAKLTMNSDYEMLKSRQSEGKNKTILSYKDFRRAISLCIDRDEFCRECTVNQLPGYGILSEYYISSLESGRNYRDSEYAEKALCRVYEAEKVSEISGYDIKKAAELFEKAYKAAIEAGDISEKDTVELEFLMYSSDEEYTKIFEYIESSIAKALKGTGLEGKVKIILKEDRDYYSKSYEGQFEIVLTILGGTQFKPYAVMKAYCDDYAACSEYKWGSDEVKIELELEGETLIKSFTEWYTALRNEEYGPYDSENGEKILAAMEECLLESYAAVPLYYSYAYSLTSRRCSYASAEYTAIIGYGGLKYIKYSLNDSDWDEYCRANNNLLDY